MIYVYIKNGGIIKKSEDVVNGLSYDAVEWLDYKMSDKLIYEKGKVIKYEESDQYKKDHGIVGVAEERDRLKKELSERDRQYDRLSCDFLKLRAQYDLLRKRQIIE